MYKLLLFALIAAFFMVMHALQTDEELAMHTLFQAKHALNAASHAAAQQHDPAKLSRGIPSIDAVEAERAALLYVRANLRLDADNRPLAGTFLRDRVEVLVFDVVNENQAFPFVYNNPAYSYTVELNRPGVIIIIRLEYPRTFPVLGPIIWEIKSASELVY